MYYCHFMTFNDYLSSKITKRKKSLMLAIIGPLTKMRFGTKKLKRYIVILEYKSNFV